MGEESPLPVPARAEANDPGCCEISATEPAPLTSLVATPGAAREALSAPLALARLSVPPATLAPTRPEAPRHSTPSSLSLLYCVLLI